VSRPAVLRSLGGPGGFAAWAAAEGDVRVLFTGRGGTGGSRLDRRSILAAVAGEAGAALGTRAAPAVAGLRQVHGAVVLEARGRGDLEHADSDDGACGNGDALVTGRRGLALSVVTADCVPVLVAAGRRVAAIHAGWRGVVAGVVAATVGRLREVGAGEPTAWSAWIGPAIGGCCYEVGDDVAAAVAAASTPEAVLEGGRFRVGGASGDRPHVDLAAAVRHQLAAAGVERIGWRIACTRCDFDALWSHRRDGGGAGRNHAFVWRV